jgi:hypothetical protein
MSKRVVFAAGDGTAIIFAPATEKIAQLQSAATKSGVALSDEQMAVVAAARRIEIETGSSNATVCEDTDIPTDTTFRGAWMRGTDTAVTVSMPRALAIAKDAVRTARAPLITALDVLFTKAQGAKNQTAADAAEARRQKLRDAPADTRLSAATDPAALKTAMAAVIADMQKT